MRRRFSFTETRALTTALCLPDRTFLNWGKKDDAKPSSDNKKPDTNAAPGGFPGMGGGFDMSKMQDFMKQSPDKQLDMMKKAMEVQKTMSKIPGIGRVAAKNVEMMEKLLKMQEQSVKGQPPNQETQKKMEAEVKSFLADRAGQASPPPPPSPSGSSGGGGGGSVAKGPTLDELKRLNLGSEIEALFEELRTIRQRKNHYRNLYHQREKEHEESTKEAVRLRTIEESLRGKLQLAEQNVMLLNSEGLEQKEALKQLKAVKAQNSELNHRVAALSRNDTQPLLKKIESLEHDVQGKQEVIRSLHRKLDRLRVRDPLQTFSVAAMSDVLRFSGTRTVASSTDEAASAADGGAASTAVNPVAAAFEVLQAQYDRSRRVAWESAAAEDGAAAKVMTASTASLLASHIPFATLDAVVVVQGDVSKAKAAFAAMGIELVASSSSADANSLTASLAADAVTPVSLGPYGYAVALHMCLNAMKDFGFEVTSAHPTLTETLMKNAARTSLTYDTSRSGGPGGQAANVAETQVNARLKVDGNAVLLVSEAQDSRSALANKQSATERLYDTRRMHWNKSIGAKQKLSEVVAAMRAHVQQQESATTASTAAAASAKQVASNISEYVPMVKTALDGKQVHVLQAASVMAVQQLLQQ